MTNDSHPARRLTRWKRSLSEEPAARAGGRAVLQQGCPVLVKTVPGALRSAYTAVLTELFAVGCAAVVLVRARRDGRAVVGRWS